MLNSLLSRSVATRRPPVKKSRLFDKSSSFTDPKEPAPAPLSPRSRRRLAVLSYQKLQGSAESAPSVSSGSLLTKERDSSDTWVDLMGASAPCVASFSRLRSSFRLVCRERARAFARFVNLDC